MENINASITKNNNIMDTIAITDISDVPEPEPSEIKVVFDYDE